MNQPAPAPSPPALPVSLAANPKLSSWLKFSSTGQVTVSPGKVEIGQGIVTALAQIAADELDIDLSRVQMIRASTASQPQRGRHLGQPLHPAVGPRAAPRLCRGSPDLSSAGGGTAGGRYRCARHRGRHHFRTGQCQDQLLGTCRRSLARSRCHARRNAKDRIAPGVGREFNSADRHSGQGFGPAAIHPRSGAWRECCMAACCGRRTRARNLSN